ncbi:hypothetical protein [Streptomyces sp. NPDC002889]|uniref:hypothetical protein n=1 Tax=Streptomyces sp. NPDC002889 TaxID=3364669 RepID=UPI003694A5B0
MSPDAPVRRVTEVHETHSTITVRISRHRTVIRTPAVGDIHCGGRSGLRRCAA